ncbi:MAG: ATPase, T2SS/T4P/T4SS family [Chloroflexota bacterium]
MAEKPAKKDLGEMLLDEKLVTPEQLARATEIQRSRGGALAEILVREGYVKSEELAVVQSVLLNVPFIDLKRHVIQPDAIKLIPEEMARRHNLIPMDVIGDSLMVVMANPGDVRTIEDIRARAGRRVEVALGIPADIQQAIDLNYRSVGEITRQVSQFAPAVEDKAIVTSDIIARTPVAQSLELIITQAVRDRASDVHIEPQAEHLRVRYRVDGVLRDAFSLPLSANAPLVSRVKVLGGMDIAEQRRPQDGQFSMKIGEKDIDIRAATMESAYGERVTLRILDKSLSIIPLADLGFTPDALERYRSILRSPFGLLLVSGPTGSGKTTTLYASINTLDRIQRNIITIEDPIEYRFENISQTQVNPKAGITFASGLRAAMRHNPDVILVGEIRDKDTVTTAVQAALTGHLVLSSIHANDAPGVLFRLLDLGVERYLITSTLVGVVAQRMLRRICPYCRTAYEPTAEERAAYEEEMKEKAGAFFVGAGCNLCGNTGFRGRTGLYEVLVMTDRIRDMVLKNAGAVEIKAQAVEDGMTTMRHNGMVKASEGITTLGEVLRTAFAIG